MRRRLLLGSTVAVAISPDNVRAQQKAMPVIGFLGAGVPIRSPWNVVGFRRGLSETGYIEGQNLTIEYAWAEGHLDRMPALAADLVARKVDVIVAATDPAARAAKNATSRIPIVFVSGDDPVRQDLVASLPQPGGNLTGVSFLLIELNPKRFELLREIVPEVRAIALLVSPDNPAIERIVKDVQEAAQKKGVQLQILKASTDSEIDGAFAALIQRRAGALLVTTDPFFGSHRRELVTALAARHSIPAMYEFSEFATAGGLISYGTSFAAIFRQVGIYAGRILKGAKPTDLPVVQPTTLELAINLKAAKALSLTIPPSILARADEVIE